MKTLKNLSVASLGIVLIAFADTGTAGAAEFFGRSQPLGEGFARSFVTLDDQGNPSEIGVTLTPGALSLPTGNSAPDIPVFLSLPTEASVEGLNHIELTYRPGGYPWLPQAFAVPRFTIDTFLISPQERSLICPNANIDDPQSTCPRNQLATALKPPEPEFLPQNFLPTGIVEPRFGARYFDSDLLPPLIQGQTPFTTLYDYAFFNGQMSLIGFGSTIDVLETQPNISNPIKLPNSYPKSGYYPTGYSVRFDPTIQEYRTALTGLTYRSVPELSPTFGLLVLGVLGVTSLVKNKLQKQKLVC
ncbi:hypothetical protein LC613_37850 [Nostoc sphaeroides CHAB 2801]|uniref:hypothetical protein n=1 Tax=Nostoc sphaeroides TaxID=446679 RepID=UPI001E4AD54D|nr:hypothetical protein [Nostoc sphaeroides]MCC5633255.1 hypothetical protein [Nostoc sphaeroides CHAB 2801]